MKRPALAIVTPALAAANNGNWQTARRWAAMLAPAFRVRLTDHWDGGDEAALIALHARRSAASVAAWRAMYPHRPLVVVLTGTDLYRDVDTDADAQRSLQSADRLVVLNELGAQRLPAALRERVVVSLQSAPARRPLPKPRRHLRAVMVGHLRAEKAPDTFLQAALVLRQRPDIRLDLIGDALEPAWADAAHQAQAQCPALRWLGPLPHAAARRRIQAAHLLVQPSRMEGGAHTVIEALVSGTAVLASRVDGNVGLLGADYTGLFEPGDAAGLARLLEQARDDPAMLPRLQQQCATRAPLFAPEREARRLRELMTELIHAAVP